MNATTAKQQADQDLIEANEAARRDQRWRALMRRLGVKVLRPTPINVARQKKSLPGQKQLFD